MARPLQFSPYMKNQNEQERDPKAPQRDDKRSKQSNTGAKKEGQQDDTARDDDDDATPRDAHGRFTVVGND